MKQIDVFIPLYNAEPYLPRLFKGIESQKGVQINKVLFAITDSKDNTFSIVEKSGYPYFIVHKDEFSHSLVREKGMNLCESSIVIFLTQDVLIERPDVFYELTKDIGVNNVVHCFAHQISMSKGIEKYTREKNYPKQSYIVSKEDIGRMQIKAFYSSDACAAYDRNVFLQLGGFDGKKIQVSEEMYYCRKALLAGYKIEYCSNSVVIHSHNFTLKEVYHRYYDIGIFFAQNPEFTSYRSNGAGFSLAMYIFRRALQEFNFPVIFRFIPDMIARFLGKRKGMKDYEAKNKTVNS
jgi:rhamnosyltransferase